MNVRSLAMMTCIAAASTAAAQTSPGNLAETAGGGTAGADSLQVIPKNGQSTKQVWADRYECYRWAVNQSGFDPARSASATAVGTSGEDGYRRAFTACLEVRGYMVAPAPAAPPASAPPAPAIQTPILPVPVPLAAPGYGPLPPQRPELEYEPLALQIEGGYTVTADGNSPVDDGSNVGVGLTWFPTSNLPVGLRVDGSYGWFRLTDAAVTAAGAGYTHGDEDIYGGDADLQFDLAHRSSSYKFYLFGGAGWYRERENLRAVEYEAGTACGYFYCYSAYFPTVVASQHTTSPWLHSWNAGLGFETAIASHASFFLEARYLRIGPESTKLDVVPIRVGLRF